MISKKLKTEIITYFKSNFQKKRFVPGETTVSVSGKVFNSDEFLNGVEAVLDGWWTEGRFASRFEKEFRKMIGVNYVSLTNSGSSANLLAVSSLTSKIFGKKALKPGDEVITVATSFPTTVNPIIQNRCVPVFIDVDLYTKNATVKSIKAAISPKTRAIMMAHTLGNPCPIEGILELVEKYGLWFIEDCCDALGSKYNQKPVGTAGHIATFSFYPAHQITMGEGGAVVTNNPLIHRSMRQFRDWGRDCWCDTGKDNTCGKRFGWQLGKLPFGYDHKYSYSQIGYNLKLTDMQAAIGLAQLRKLNKFVKIRKSNFQRLLYGLRRYEKYFIFSNEEYLSDPAWFGFMLVVKKDAPFSRHQLVNYLEEYKVVTRSLFAGNLLKHPAYLYLKNVRIAESLRNSDLIMKNGFWIGVYPGLTDEMLDYVISIFRKFLSQFK